MDDSEETRWRARTSMRARAQVVRAVGVAGVALALAGCADSKDVSLINDSEQTVTVEFGNDESEEIPDHGGVVLLDVDECFEGPVIVTYGDGNVVDLPGPICPDDELRIRAEDAAISRTHAP